MSVQGGVEEMKSGRIVLSAEVEPMSDIWFYQDGLIKNKARKNDFTFDDFFFFFLQLWGFKHNTATFWSSFGSAGPFSMAPIDVVYAF